MDGLAWIHRGDAFVVVSKPSGLLSVPGRGEHLQDCVARRVQAEFADALVVHRLDMATSGLMLLARGSAAQRALGIAFAQRKIEKRYVAVVAGKVPVLPGDGWGEIDLPLTADWPNRPRQQVDRDRGKPSLTHYRIISQDRRANTTRLELRPFTGRSHQLRVHLGAIGHPILGDTLYAPADVQAQAGRLLLHASSLGLRYPASGERFEFADAPPF